MASGDVQRIESDYRSTLETVREHLRSVSATLEAQVEAMLTVAEGVETAEQFKLLRLLSCDQSQGYFHCPPAPAREIDRLLAQDQ